MSLNNTTSNIPIAIGTPNSLKLPKKYTQWFPEQREAIEFVINSSKKVVFLEMPTGGGKTLVSKALFNASSLQGSIVTNNTDLQNQFVKDFPEVVLLKGRTHFTCDIDESVTAAEAACTAGFQCPYKFTHNCGYYSQILDSKQVQTTIENYPFFLNHQVYSEDKRKIQLLVCDEGHHLDNQLKSFTSFSISRKEVKDCFLPEPPESVNPFDWIIWAKQIEDELTLKVEDAIDALNQKPSSGHFYQEQIVPSYLETIKFKKYTELSRKLNLLLNYSGGNMDEWFVQGGKTSGVTEFRLIDAKQLFQIMDDIVEEKIVIMSATLGDIDHAAAQLNIPSYDKLIVKDTYDKNKRPIFYVQGLGRFTNKADPTKSLFRKAVGGIDDILDRHAGETGIIHTASHERAKMVLLGTRHKDRMIGHEPNGTLSRSEAIAEFKSEQGDKVLVSPSILEGIDLPDDQCRFIIFAKAPYEDPTDPLIKQSLEREGWAGAVHRLIIKTKQGIGRGIRSRDDYCTVYLLDEAFDTVLLNSNDEVFKYVQTIEIQK